ncbi:MAG: serine hydrolase [Clostridia bacterium]|nr:serine hydrolase [Clostridia bacterium]
MAVKDKYAIPRARFPEQVGVDSKEIKALIEDFEENEIEVHSMMILRHGKVAYEGWRNPYSPESPHTMYSVSKSFVGIAMGYAVEEGLVTLDTKVIDIFPEYRPRKKDKNLEAMTVYHLLTMTAGKDVSVMSDKKKEDWIKDFFNSRWAFAPGEGWRYISENTYMCCAIIQRLTGLTVREYLTPRLFKPLGFTRTPFWEVDHHGLEAGGWGLFITTEELARFILCLQQNGMYAGERVIPESWVKLATGNLVSNDQYEEPDAKAGYGFFFWRCALENTYRADGMFSQFGYVFGDYDAAFIITASEIIEDKARVAINRHFPKIFCKERRISPKDACDDLELSPMPVLEAKKRSTYEKLIEGRKINFLKNPVLNAAGWPLSMLTLPVTYMSAEKGGNIDNVELKFSENECTFTWDEGKEHNTIVCGMDGEYRKSKIRLAGIDFTAVSYAAWENENTLEIWMRPLESICERRIKLTFNGDNVRLIPESSPSLSAIAEYLSSLVPAFIPNAAVAQLGQKAMMGLDKILEFPLFGSME